MNYIGMNQQQCPVCYSELEVVNSTPCFVCGCWQEGAGLEKELKKDNFSVYGLVDDTEIVLCSSCYLDEVLAFQGELVDELKIRKEEAHAGIRFLNFEDPHLFKDKYCYQCKKRLALLKVIARNEKNS